MDTTDSLVKAPRQSRPSSIWRKRTESRSSIAIPTAERSNSDDTASTASYRTVSSSRLPSRGAHEADATAKRRRLCADAVCVNCASSLLTTQDSSMELPSRSMAVRGTVAISRGASSTTSNVPTDALPMRIGTAQCNDARTLVTFTGSSSTRFKNASSTDGCDDSAKYMRRLGRTLTMDPSIRAKQCSGDA